MLRLNLFFKEILNAKQRKGTADILEAKGLKTPHFHRDGFKKTFRNLAEGRTYTHPSCQVRFPNPVTFSQKAANLLIIGCNFNMFFYRSFYLVAFGQALKFGREHISPKIGELTSRGTRYFQAQHVPSHHGKEVLTPKQNDHTAEAAAPSQNSSPPGPTG